MNDKTYRALRHDYTRNLQKTNNDLLHHPDEKINQIKEYTKNTAFSKKIKILELFGGHGNLTKEYVKLGKTTVFEKDKSKVEILKSISDELEVVKTDSFNEIFHHVYKKKKYDIIDIDPYGFPYRLFPHIFLLMEKSLVFLTIPKPYVNILNGITQTTLMCHFGESNPSIDTILSKIVVWGLSHWRQVEVLDILDLKSVWRVCLDVKRIKATEYTGTKNRKDTEVEVPNDNLSELIKIPEKEFCLKSY